MEPSSTGLAFTRDQRWACSTTSGSGCSPSKTWRPGSSVGAMPSAAPRLSAPLSSRAAAALTNTSCPSGSSAAIPSATPSRIARSSASLRRISSSRRRFSSVTAAWAARCSSRSRSTALNGDCARITASTWLCPTPIASAFACGEPRASSARSSAGVRSPMASRGVEDAVSRRSRSGGRQSARSASTVVASRTRSSAGRSSGSASPLWTRPAWRRTSFARASSARVERRKARSSSSSRAIRSRAFARDQAQQRGGRDGQQVRVLVDLGGEHGEEADRREHRVHQVDEREHRQQLGREDAGAEVLARGRGARGRTANWATRAISRTAQRRLLVEQRHRERRARSRTSRRAITTASRSGCARRRSRSGSSPSTPPSVTSSGTAAAGVRKSIGTNTICVGRMRPVPELEAHAADERVGHDEQRGRDHRFGRGGRAHHGRDEEEHARRGQLHRALRGRQAPRDRRVSALQKRFGELGGRSNGPPRLEGGTHRCGVSVVAPRDVSVRKLGRSRRGRQTGPPAGWSRKRRRTGRNR